MSAITKITAASACNEITLDQFVSGSSAGSPETDWNLRHAQGTSLEPAGPFDRLFNAGCETVRAMGAFVRRKITERALMALDDHTLKDIGLHRSEIVSAVLHGDRRCGRRSVR